MTHLRIVVLDGHTLTPNHPSGPTDPAEPSWDQLAALGPLEIHRRTPADQIRERMKDAAIVLTNKTPIDADTIDATPSLKYIGIMATGMNIVDVAHAKARGIEVANAPAYGTASVAQHTFALILALTSRVAEHDAAVRGGAWSAGPDFCFTVAPLSELADKTLGIVGLGDIGRQVASIGHAMGMRIASVPGSSGRRAHVPGVEVAWHSLEDLITQSDVLTLHCPLTDQTAGMINTQRLAKMKHNALLINTGRGALIDESALRQALEENRLGGAALDVLNSEPPPSDHPLIGLPRCIVTPHIAWATQEARQRLMRIVVDKVRTFMDQENSA
ncbi:MAG: D-2-hydroxyacid dehydrogenase [Planctomycetota bacterium]